MDFTQWPSNKQLVMVQRKDPKQFLPTRLPSDHVILHRSVYFGARPDTIKTFNLVKM